VEASAADRLERRDLRAERDGRLHDIGVAGDAAGNLLASHEAVRIRSIVGPAREGRRPVRGDESELVPAILPSAAETAATLDHDVLTPRLREKARHRKAGVAGADHQHIHAVRQRDARGGDSLRVSLGPVR
jgi:hypothetical protein